jgi:oligopeptide transport system ATP-binding protein
MERGSTHDIFKRAKHPYTWALLKSVPKLARNTKDELYTLHGTPPDLILPLVGCAFAARCEYCMSICKKEKPVETKVSDTQSLSCWLTHPDAPKVIPFYGEGELK